jgi:hypothetical protein
MTPSKDTPAISSASAELRSRRLANESAARAERTNKLVKLLAGVADDRCDLLVKFSQIDRIFSDIDQMFADIARRLTVLEKSRSALAVQPPRRGLTPWSPEGLAAALRSMSPAEIAKLTQ